MSSRFAATICGHVIRRQSELGITGHIAEIGTFEGRFFIAMALGLAPGEHALGIDTFNWPNDGLLDLFHSHCARHGLARERYTAIKGNVRDLAPDDIRKTLGGPVRFWHVDGDHSREHLTADLDLAAATLHPQRHHLPRRHAASGLSAARRRGARMDGASSRTGACCA